MTRIMPQGLFHILHPGHLYYLGESGKLGEKLYVVIAHDSRGKEKKDSVLNEQARLGFVDAFKMVDDARLGTEDEIYDILLRSSPMWSQSATTTLTILTISNTNRRREDTTALRLLGLGNTYLTTRKSSPRVKSSDF